MGKDYSHLKGKHFMAFNTYKGTGEVEVFVAEIDFDKGITLKYADLGEARGGHADYYCLNKSRSNPDKYTEEFMFILEDIESGHHPERRVKEYYLIAYGDTVYKGSNQVTCAFE